MQRLRGSCSTDAVVAVAMSWVAIQLQQEHSVGSSSNAEKEVIQKQSSMQVDNDAIALSLLRGSVSFR